MGGKRRENMRQAGGEAGRRMPGATVSSCVPENGRHGWRLVKGQMGGKMDE